MPWVEQIKFCKKCIQPNFTQKAKKMKILLDIKDDRADFVLELLKSLSFVKTEQLTPTKARFLHELRGAVAEVTLAKKGKI